MEGKQLSLFSEEPENPENFFERKRDWSASKHRILLKYLQAFCYNLGGNEKYQSEHINYVDAFAGPGKYKEGIGIEDFVNNSNFWTKYQHNFENTDGSPLIALKCANLFGQEKRVNLRCFFVEAEAESNQQLQDNCRDLGKDLFYKVYENQKFEVAFPEVMNDLNSYPTLFFLDTFAVKGVTFEHICEIGNYVRQNKGELFILFHNSAVARHAGQYKTVYDSIKEQKTAETFIENLTKLLGINSDQDWKPKWLELKDQPQQFEKWALEYFKKRMKIEAGFRGATSFEIKESYSDPRPKYSIVVGSNHPKKAFGSFLNDFVWEEERLLFFKDSHTGIKKFLEKEWNSEQQKRLAEIKTQAIKTFGKLNDWISFDDAITHLILEMNDIGRLKRTHYNNDVLDWLYTEQLIEIKHPSKQKKPYTLKSHFRLKK